MISHRMLAGMVAQRENGRVTARDPLRGRDVGGDTAGHLISRLRFCHDGGRRGGGIFRSVPAVDDLPLINLDKAVRPHGFKHPAVVCNEYERSRVTI